MRELARHGCHGHSRKQVNRLAIRISVRWTFAASNAKQRGKQNSFALTFSFSITLSAVETAWAADDKRTQDIIEKKRILEKFLVAKKVTANRRAAQMRSCNACSSSHPLYFTVIGYKCGKY
jgi:hypothetical protein